MSEYFKLIGNPDLCPSVLFLVTLTLAQEHICNRSKTCFVNLLTERLPDHNETGNKDWLKSLYHYILFLFVSNKQTIKQTSFHNDLRLNISDLMCFKVDIIKVITRFVLYSDTRKSAFSTGLPLRDLSQWIKMKWSRLLELKGAVLCLYYFRLDREP